MVGWRLELGRVGGDDLHRAGVLGVVIWVVASIVRSSGAGRARDAKDILAERFARGEIDEDEFRHRRELLHGRR